jgi:hypothetical protein
VKIHLGGSKGGGKDVRKEAMVSSILSNLEAGTSVLGIDAGILVDFEVSLGNFV